MQFETIIVSKKGHIAFVELNNPSKHNSLIYKFWGEFKQAFEDLDKDPVVRCIILSGQGKHFCSGIDSSRSALLIRQILGPMQDGVSAVEKCNKPVIAAVHNACIGAGVDIISACDIRLASADAKFSVKEVDIGLCADVGSLQRFPKVVGNQSWVREVCFTGRTFHADEALKHGFISQIYGNQQELEVKSLELANVIASKSPIAVMGTKRNLVYSRDHSVEEGLEYVKTWNHGMLQTKVLV
ncbi:enoyl-CoA hydratase [Rozella allomycis CSF55]|uniref:Enoyl-CoA hydratase n=1 Tax=Rozella allomycis (strain CSF55) TaxID=988480 RepID=A0A4P9YIC8_ROZAC|nr:enoyl-CoA hydratase [Rozella allomycis CSF55]